MCENERHWQSSPGDHVSCRIHCAITLWCGYHFKNRVEKTSWTWVCWISTVSRQSETCSPVLETDALFTVETNGSTSLFRPLRRFRKENQKRCTWHLFRFTKYKRLNYCDLHNDLVEADISVPSSSVLLSTKVILRKSELQYATILYIRLQRNSINKLLPNVRCALVFQHIWPAHNQKCVRIWVLISKYV